MVFHRILSGKPATSSSMLRFSSCVAQDETTRRAEAQLRLVRRVFLCLFLRAADPRLLPLVQRVSVKQHGTLCRSHERRRVTARPDDPLSAYRRVHAEFGCRLLGVNPPSHLESPLAQIHSQYALYALAFATCFCGSASLFHARTNIVDCARYDELYCFLGSELLDLDESIQMMILELEQELMASTMRPHP